MTPLPCSNRSSRPTSPPDPLRPATLATGRSPSPLKDTPLKTQHRTPFGDLLADLAPLLPTPQFTMGELFDAPAGLPPGREQIDLVTDSSGTTIYVGRTTRAIPVRMREHLSDARCGNGAAFARIISRTPDHRDWHVAVAKPEECTPFLIAAIGRVLYQPDVVKCGPYWFERWVLRALAGRARWADDAPLAEWSLIALLDPTGNRTGRRYGRGHEGTLASRFARRALGQGEAMAYRREQMESFRVS